MNRQGWAITFLDSSGLPAGPYDPVSGIPSGILAVVVWINSEGSSALFNPLDTEWVMPGSTNYNPQGVQNYTSLTQGLVASRNTLFNGKYDQLLSKFKSGASADTIIKAIWYSPWGSKPTQNMLDNARHNYARYATVHVTGTGPTNPLPSPANITSLLWELLMQGTNGAIVRYLYLELLLREPDTTGFKNDVAFLNAGGTVTQLIANIADSAEGKSVNSARRKALGLPAV